MGEQPLLDTAQEYQLELKAFGRVQAHQLHAIFPGLGLGFTSFQRGMG